DIAKDYPDVTLEFLFVDNAAMQMILNPKQFDVILTENMFGDILTDEASVLAGSMGMLPSASLSESTVGLYEPIHGSAPDIAGQGIANPIGTILSCALMLRYSFKLEDEACAIEKAVDVAIANGARTADLGGTLKTHQMTDEILKNL
ncbi:MAG: isocitrate/isopropylmalate family dehydrogenase, partial [Anaerolineales bacterium]